MVLSYITSQLKHVSFQRLHVHTRARTYTHVYTPLHSPTLFCRVHCLSSSSILSKTNRHDYQTGTPDSWILPSPAEAGSW
ncbi:hypothetical protein AMELA_G00225790 [Ameiurus melas]|uniref:Uncharacterized protein n=1 Tax=Ameiurus melas TaxID=219545 RepID=A0A7J5ZZJ0_AMEME|nr:hypothetical protein AMELA_G00225790 [Ameiurus melas]